MVKLIIVDDEKSTREGLVQYIPWESLGVSQVESAGSGLEALQAAERLHPDIVVSDIRMPGMNGIEFATRVRGMLPDCKIIFLSGYADKEYLKAAIQLRAVHYLEKPINRTELKRVVREAVDAAVMERTAKEESDALLQEKLALDLIGERSANANPAPQLKHAFGDLPPGGSFITGILRVDIRKDRELIVERHYRAPIREAIAEAFASPLYRSISGFIDNRHIVIHFYGKGITGRSIQPAAFARLKDRIEQASGASVELFLAVGRRADGAAEVRESYRTAELALQEQFFAGPDRMAIYEDKADERDDFRLDSALLQPFLAGLHAGDKDKAQQELARLHDEIKRRPGLPVRQVRELFYDMLLALHAFAERYNIMTIEAHEQASLRDAFMQLPHLAAILKDLSGRVDAVMSRVLAKSSNGQHVFAITQHIHEHYGDERLSINRMAERLYLTPTYLCRIFKERTGQTINSYITDVRIEQAKTLLRDRRVKLSEISRRVGYQSANHFTKIFKKTTGMNPSEFRERQ
ncbi:response regulator [Cohnella sp. JJ-181]|uniref:response regulator n=1 Tax=Cohnella rhizoplanae TaxID=2974897 RepID=UPI0022FFBA31|nr:response regulator [Cohnella sp. JJ-181]CAI6059368.1 HTH-type transcriptional activator RhaR [Cohnella sp. JJ-181]